MKLKIFALSLLTLLFLGCSGDSSSPENKTETIDLAKLDGTEVEATLSGSNRIKDFKFSNAQGKAVVAVYWSTTCPPCLAEIPHLIKLQDKYKDTIQIVGIYVEDKEKKEVEEFVKYHEINYDILYGEGNYDLADAMGGVRGIPAMFIFDKEGKLTKNFVGLLPPEMLEAEIKKLI